MTDSRQVASLPLSVSIIDILHSNGFRSLDDFIGLEALDIQEECKLNREQALEVWRCIDHITNPIQQTNITGNTFNPNVNTNRNLNEIDASVKLSNSNKASNTIQILSFKDMIETAKTEVPIITFCRAIDELFGTKNHGGLPRGVITEFCGVPGIGKTQIAMQLCLNVQIPSDLFGGCGGEAIYIDTEGSFMIERVYSMAQAISSHLTRLITSKLQSSDNDSQRNRLLSDVSIDSFLSGIHVNRVHDQTEFLAVIHQLKSFITANPRIKLIVIDSIAFPFRQAIQDSSHRTRILASVAQELNILANKHRIAVALMNHVTTRVVNNPTSISSTSIASKRTQTVTKIVPALGEQWSHAITNRILLQWESPKVSSEEDIQNDRDDSNIRVANAEKLRLATLIKSPNRPAGSATFQINEQGVRDAVTAVQTQRLTRSLPQEATEQNKRSRT